MSKCAICRKHTDAPISWEKAIVCKECYPLCEKCHINKFSDLFWESHQAMSNGSRILCVNSSTKRM
jgi:hypothetical protein